MSLLGLGGPKAFVTLGNVSHDGTNPLIYFHYVLCNSDGTFSPGPVDTWWTDSTPFNYNDNTVTIQAKIRAQLLLANDTITLNTVFI